MTSLTMPQRGDDTGTSLAELLVTMMLSMIVLGVITAMVTSIGSTVVTERGRANDLGTAFTTMDQVNRVLRATVGPDSRSTEGVRSAGTSQVTVYSTYEPRTGSAAPRIPREFTFQLSSSGQLTMRTREPVRSGTTWTYTGAGVTRVLATDLTNPVGAAPSVDDLFRYYDSKAVQLPTASLTTAAARSEIARIEICLLVLENPGDRQPVALRETVRFANYNNADGIPLL